MRVLQAARDSPRVRVKAPHVSEYLPRVVPRDRDECCKMPIRRSGPGMRCNPRCRDEAPDVLAEQQRLRHHPVMSHGRHHMKKDSQTARLSLRRLKPPGRHPHGTEDDPLSRERARIAVRPEQGVRAKDLHMGGENLLHPSHRQRLHRTDIDHQRPRLHMGADGTKGCTEGRHRDRQNHDRLRCGLCHRPTPDPRRKSSGPRSLCVIHDNIAPAGEITRSQQPKPTAAYQTHRGLHRSTSSLCDV